MLDEAEFRRLLNFTQEPVLIVERSGRIETANQKTHEILGDSIIGRKLSEFVVTPADTLDTYLKRCAASGNPVVGSIVLRDRTGKELRLQIKGAVLSKKNGKQSDRIVLRCSSNAFRDFTHLSRQVEELSRENRRQRHDRAALRETLAQKDVLLRELQHRVRNHTQMMLSMISSARREARSEELLVFLDSLQRRLTALGTVQQLMYQTSRFEAVSAQELINSLCKSISESWPPGARLEVDCVETELSNEAAVPIALILNELLSNALKHGLTYGSGAVSVQLHEDVDDLVLSVSDTGPGFDASSEIERQSSGMMLVRGLCRQIGGALTIGSESGTCCTVRFPRTR